MARNTDIELAVEMLQELGLKEYEARCFVGLSRMSDATAKELSEITDVPRTRIYDAVRVLQDQGLVEIQHSSPQRFRSVPLEEAMETLSNRYKSRVETLRDVFTEMDRVETDQESVMHEVWSLTGTGAITNRSIQLLKNADEEVIVVIGREEIITPELLEALNIGSEYKQIVIGAVTESLADQLQTEVPNARTFVSAPEWLGERSSPEINVSIGRLLLMDRESLLVSSYHHDTNKEQAILAEGIGNGLIVIARRLLSTGLLEVQS